MISIFWSRLPPESVKVDPEQSLTRERENCYLLCSFKIGSGEDEVTPEIFDWDEFEPPASSDNVYLFIYITLEGTLEAELIDFGTNSSGGTSWGRVVNPEIFSKTLSTAAFLRHHEDKIRRERARRGKRLGEEIAALVDEHKRDQERLKAKMLTVEILLETVRSKIE